MTSTNIHRATRRSLHLALFGVIATMAIACGGATDTRRGNGGSTPSPSAPDPHASGRDVLAIALGTEVRLLSLDGGQRSILAGDSFFSGISGVDLIGGGRFLVVRAYAESTPSTGLRLALVQSDGAVRWTRPFAVSFAGGNVDTALEWGIGLGEDGNVVLDDRATQDFHIASIGAAPGELPGFFPIGSSVDGFLPVRSAWTASDPYAVTYGWWKVGGDSTLANVTQQTSTTGLDAADSVSFAGKLLRLAMHDGVVLQVQSASGTAEIPLPQATDAARIGALGDGEMFTSDERWLLVSSGVPERVVRVDLQSKATEAIDLVAPDGFRPFANCSDRSTVEGGARIDRDGRIVRAFRNDDHVAAFSSMDGAHWSQIGGSFTSVGGMDVTMSRGTLTVRGHRGVYCYGVGPAWSSPENADFVGDWTQIVRPSANTRIASPNTTPLDYVLSRSGRYGARWDVDATTHVATLLLADLETGTEKSVATDATGIRSAQPVWLWEQ